jgi:hypothetical protein
MSYVLGAEEGSSQLTLVRQLMKPSETTCPANVAVIEAL